MTTRRQRELADDPAPMGKCNFCGQGPQPIVSSAAQWSKLAVEADAWAIYLESRGDNGEAYRNKAATCRRTVEAHENINICEECCNIAICAFL
jgi:hypothetical protein